MATAAIPPAIELREIEPDLFNLVAIVEGRDVVIKAKLDARETWSYGDDFFDCAFTVAVFQSDSTTSIRIRIAHGNRYEDAPDWTLEEWYESLDGGRRWRKRTSPGGGTLQYSRPLGIENRVLPNFTYVRRYPGARLKSAPKRGKYSKMRSTYGRTPERDRHPDCERWTYCQRMRRH